MKSFKEHQTELEEGVVRTGAIASYGVRARQQGQKAIRAFQRGREVLQRGGRDISLEERLERMEAALDALLEGLAHQKEQIGAGVAVDVAGHMLAAKERKTR